MKTMICKGNIVRVKDGRAEELRKQGYAFIPKHIWKQEVRDKK